MKTKIKIPKGWYRLKAGAIRKRGDHHYMAKHRSGKSWHPVAVSFGRIESADIEHYGAFIRRKPKKVSRK